MTPQKQTTPLVRPHRVIVVPAHVRSGRVVRSHSRRVPLRAPALPGQPINYGQTPGYGNLGNPSAALD
jgi:hypothetical protein